jgi:citrate synthase
MVDRKSERNVTVKHRDEKYADRYRTAIWQEESEHDNPFVDTDAYCRGYRFEDLVANTSYAEMVFLMIKGELPSSSQKALFEKVLVAFSHPGIRNDAVRAAILAGVGKTVPENVLPIATLVFGGSRTGAGDVEKMMRFFAKNKRKLPADVLAVQEQPIVLGQYFGEADVMAAKICAWLMGDEQETPHLHWGKALVAEAQASDANIGWTKASVAAALFCDLGFMPKFGVGLLQMMAAPGLLAQGFEHANKPATVLPFVSDDDYELSAQVGNDE